MTATPARVLRDPSIGHLGRGAHANITVLQEVPGRWIFTDAWKEQLVVQHRLLPELVMMDGEPLVPDCGLLSDLMAPDERPRGITRAHAPGLGTPRLTAEQPRRFSRRRSAAPPWCQP